MKRIVLLVVVFFVLGLGFAHADEGCNCKSDCPYKTADNGCAKSEKKAAEQPKQEEGKVKAILVTNSVCPVSGKPVGGSPEAPNFYSDFGGYRIGFMCPVCKGKFDSSSDVEKQKLLDKALAGPRKVTDKK